MAKPIRVRCTRLNPLQPGQKLNVLKGQACFCSCASKAGALDSLFPVVVDFHYPIHFRREVDLRFELGMLLLHQGHIHSYGSSILV